MQTSIDTSVGQAGQGGASALTSIQASVRSELDQVRSELRRIVLSDFDMIEEVNEHLLLLQGKLFRPTLLLLSSRVSGEPHPDSRTLAAVVELVHLATLVHDDAVDHSVLRRGMPTVNALWTHQVAIIMGDYLYSRAVTELAQLGHLDALAVLAGAANEMSVGEMRQLTSFDALDFTEQDYYRLIAAKTASLMSASCEMGSLAGGAECREQLALFGHNLGMAFQIADDLLDYTADEEVLGKPVGGDIREGKMTLPAIYLLQQDGGRARGLLEEIIRDRTISPASWSELRGLLTEGRVLDRAFEKAVEFATAAKRHLGQFPQTPELESLMALPDYILARDR